MHGSVFKSLPNNYKGLVGFRQYKKASQAINTDKTVSIQSPGPVPSPGCTFH